MHWIFIFCVKLYEFGHLLSPRSCGTNEFSQETKIRYQNFPGHLQTTCLYQFQVSSNFLAVDEDFKWNCQQLESGTLGNWPIRPINTVCENSHNPFEIDITAL